MTRVDLPEPIWNAVHAASESEGKSEGAISEENGYIGSIFNGVYFQFCPENGVSKAVRLSSVPKETLEGLATAHVWSPLFIEGRVTRSRV